MNELIERSEGKMVTDSTWNTLYKQAAEILKSGFLPTSIKTPAQAIAVILTGRELGIGMMESFRGIYIIENKPSISPQLMLSLIYNSGVAENIKIESTATACTVSGNRKGQPLISVTFTEQDAASMGLLYRDNWKKQKANMLRWRCISAWARLACPDVIGGLYTPDEIDNAGDEIGKDVSALDLSEKLNSDPTEYEKFAQDTKTAILDALAVCEDEKALYNIKKGFQNDIMRLLDNDRAFIVGEIEHKFAQLVSASNDTAEGVIVPPTEELKGETAPSVVTVDLEQQEKESKAFINQVMQELSLLSTKAQVTVFKAKHEAGAGKLMKEYREFYDTLIENAFKKVKGV